VQDYFVGGAGVLLAIDRERTRACPGGVGEAKCGGNYAASMYSLEHAKAQGADQVLFLDGAEHRYVEEASAMNIFFVYEDKLITPRLSGSILHGVTRDSIINLARQKGLKVEEQRIPMDQIIEDAKNGNLRECFLCGTAAVITPVRAFLDRGEEIAISKEYFGKVAMPLRKDLVDIQTGRLEGPAGWVQRLATENQGQLHA
jgi:branched-chain amino acid aminotransferase